ncbi:MAG: hypothetical protein ACTHO8_03760 [Solirubrobacterales bacterium]
MTGTTNGGAPSGRLEVHRLGDLTVLEHIQRVPRDSRVKALAKNGWQPKKQGILLVARIADGDHTGTLHVYDGGTRWRVGLRTVGEDYEIPCWVEEMSEADAAEKFDIFNSESKKPTPYDHYKVGTAYGEPHQTAIKKALDSLGLEGGEKSSYGNGEPGKVAALVACKRVVTGAYKAHRELGDDPKRWALASERLAEIIGILRDAYTNEDAHDGDMIQAVARLRTQHGAFSQRVRRHLVNTIGSATAARWRSLAQSDMENAGGSQGGSESRANFIATLLATEHNRSASKGAELRTALSKVPARA